MESQNISMYDKRKEILESIKSKRDGMMYDLTCYIITYNHENCIARCINSILNQKTDYKFLIKILDDCSSDNTFNICLSYAMLYPEMVELNTLKKNSGGKMLTVAYENITTKYFCRTDGDDYWCDENKIQMALDFLEDNPEYVTYSHDTLVYNLSTGVKKSNVHHYEPNKNVTNEISFSNFFYIHVSSRIHRNVLDFNGKLKNTRKRDRILWYLLLDAGKAYYNDKIMAVYTISKSGFHNSKSQNLQRLSRVLMQYKMNKYFDYKYDNEFTIEVNDKKLLKLKRQFGKKLGWKIFVWKLYFRIVKEAIKNVKNIVVKTYLALKNEDKFTGDFKKEEFPTIDRVRKEMI